MSFRKQFNKVCPWHCEFLQGISLIMVEKWHRCILGIPQTKYKLKVTPEFFRKMPWIQGHFQQSWTTWKKYGDRTGYFHCQLKTGESLRYSHIQRIEVNQDSEQNLDLQLSWICQHGLLKEVFAQFCILDPLFFILLLIKLYLKLYELRQNNNFISFL